jgi:hypothetical protein
MNERKNVFLADYPSSVDLLRFSDYIPTLLDILMYADTPITLGVFGPWGSGKTSLLQQLKNEIEGKGLAHVRTVWVTAWKYDRHEALWRAFILRVLDALFPRKAGAGPREDRPRYSEEEITDDKQKELIAELSRLEESVYRPVDWKELGQLTLNWWQVMKEGGKAAADIFSAFLPAAALFKQAWKVLGSDEKADTEIAGVAKAFKRQVKDYHRDQLIHMEQFEKTFADALKKALGKDGRLIIFVDDLDRCLPEKAIEVLEAIKLFLEVPGTVFVLGMDKEVVERGVEVRYGNLFQALEGDKVRLDLPIRGDAYLQKMIQIPFHLPPMRVNDLESYIEKLEEGLPDRLKLHTSTRAVLAHGLFPNPRQVKRVMNIVRLLKGLVEEREKRPVEEGGLEPGKLSWPLLAKTIMIQTQWPELYRYWKEYPTLIQILEQFYRSYPMSDKEIITGEPEKRRQPKSAQFEMDLGDLGTSKSGKRGLIGTYLTDRQRYALLEKMLTYPDDAEEEKSRYRTSFIGLSKVELSVYVYLVSVADPGTPRTSGGDQQEAPALEELPEWMRAMDEEVDETEVKRINNT